MVRAFPASAPRRRFEKQALSCRWQPPRGRLPSKTNYEKVNAVFTSEWPRRNNVEPGWGWRARFITLTFIFSFWSSRFCSCTAPGLKSGVFMSLSTSLSGWPLSGSRKILYSKLILPLSPSTRADLVLRAHQPSVQPWIEPQSFWFEDPSVFSGQIRFIIPPKRSGLYLSQ